MRGTSMNIRKRLTWTFILCGLAFIVLVGRLAWVQFVHGAELQEKALEARMQDIPVEAKRGSILDRNGRELVISISVDSIYAEPRQIENPRAAADKIAPILNMDADQLYQKLTKKSAFEWIERKVDNETSEKIKALNIAGIGFVDESKRHYLEPELAPHVLGFVGVDNQGLTGIEKSYDEELRGKPGRIVIEQDAAGRQVPEALHQYIPAVQGSDLVLTMDETIQYFVERELDKAVATYKPKYAMVIVMDPKTGGILAMGNRPTFDPNNWLSEPQTVWDKNPAIWYNYEPGSTFKIVTAAAGLEENVVNVNTGFYCPGFIKVSGTTIRCADVGGHGSESFAEVVQNSCNPGFIQLGLDLGAPRFYKYLDAFGFDLPTGINLPGEGNGIVIPEAQASKLNLAIMAMGQSICVTPIQLISALATIANDGVLVKPQLVKEIRSNGQTVFSMRPEKVRQGISVETARQLRGLLENVVSQGTGVNAALEGYRVGGKTGTAQVVAEGGRGYVDGKYVASFAGFAPVDDPKIVMLVVIVEPQGAYYGGVVAAPIFQAIARDTLRYMGVPETTAGGKPKSANVSGTPDAKITVPDVVAYPADKACQIIKSAGLRCVTRGEGGLVRQQTPASGAAVAPGVTVILELAPTASGNSGGTVTVPDLKGLTIKEAGAVLEELGLRLSAEGSGVAVRQSYKPGASVKKDVPVRVIFEPPVNSRETIAAPPKSQTSTN
ncbi:MAG: penicillin-binding transpeptidase domain-containing protein [Firmicutes bacterium]|nr:penicillin-binding transpeptidase domain-containing protein [Bacillota bacterium]